MPFVLGSWAALHPCQRRLKIDPQEVRLIVEGSLTPP